MRYALFADVHGNLEAYEAVLGAIEKEGPDWWKGYKRG